MSDISDMKPRLAKERVPKSVWIYRGLESLLYSQRLNNIDLFSLSEERL